MNAQQAEKRFGGDFIQTVQQKDIPGLRSYLASDIRLEPAVFRAENGDYAQMRKYLLEVAHIDFRQPYERQEKEEKLPQERWDMDYFFRLVEWYRLNCADERLDHIEEVGKAVVPAPRAVQTAENAQSTSFQPAPGERRGRDDQKNRSLKLLLLAAAAVLAVLLVLLLGRGEHKKTSEGLMPPSQSEEISQVQLHLHYTST